MAKKMIELVEQQIIDEVGQEEWNAKEIPSKLLYMLAQKWGLRIPELLPTEINILYMEEWNAKHPK
jgi:hypothetical protein